jgi:hypothetical protein
MPRSISGKQVYVIRRHDKVNLFTVLAVNEGYAPGVDLR